MKELVFALQFKGKTHPVEGVEDICFHGQRSARSAT
jgi:hypothetical protein